MPDTDAYKGPRLAPHDDKPLLSVSEAAALLGVSISTLQRWDKSGHLPALRTPTKRRRYRRSDVLSAVTEAS